MDQKKTGQFIAALRKNRNMTQRQLAEKLDISEKTISKWECGNGLPEVTYMEPLCEILGITVNELLMGERIDIAGLLHKLDCTRLELLKQLEFEQLKMQLFKLYGIEIEEMEISDLGAGSQQKQGNLSGAGRSVLTRRAGKKQGRRLLLDWRNSTVGRVPGTIFIVVQLYIV